MDGAETEATSRVSRSAVAMLPSAAWSPARGSCATTASGPLKPWPKPSASSSYALCVVVLLGSLAASPTPIRIDSAGVAMASMIARPAIVAGHGWRRMNCAQRAQKTSRSTGPAARPPPARAAHPLTDARQQRWQHRQGSEHREQDRDRRRDGEPVEEAHAE